MIQENEIRIGNTFQHNANCCYRSPSEIKPFIFQWESRDWYAIGEGTMDLEDLVPVPLSVDFLVKNGYKNTEGWANTEGYAIKNYIVMARFDRFQINGIRYDVNYVHQLQNIHFTFTGEELDSEAEVLTINPNV